MILQEIFEEHAAQEAMLRWRNPWVDVFYNWVIAILIVAMFVGFFDWGLDSYGRNAYEAGQKDLTAAMDAEHEQMMADAEAAEWKAQQEDAALQILEAKAVARMWFGIRLITAKYHYTIDDLYTYAYCAVNRAAATGKTIMEVLAEPGQFTAYSEHNDLDTDLYNLALQFIADLHAGKLPQCDAKFKYAVLSEMGIWLVDDPGKPVPERWHV